MLSSGVAAIALDPRNGASRLMLLSGVAAAAAYLVMPFAGDHHHPSVTSSMLRVVGNIAFLTLSAGLSALLLVFPSGRVVRAWHARAATVLLTLAVIAPVLELLGSRTLSANGDADTDVRNVMARRGLRVFGEVGSGISSTEPLWFVLALGFLLWRFQRADVGTRRALRPLLVTFAVVGSLLVLVVVAGVAGFAWPQPWFQVTFLIALSAIPLVLLAGLSERSRTLNREAAASRARLLSAEDDARRRLERDLHDGVQQQLVALLSLNELATRQARGGSASLSATLGDVRSQLTDAIEELRELVNGIRPPALTDSGVAAALETRMRRLPADVSLDLAGTRDRRWPPETEAAAYFVACEAVTNALKHAPGAPVLVRLTDENGHLRVEVSDEGPGIAPCVTRGSGLLGLRDRVESMGGALSVASGPAGGTVVSAVFGT
jgi:signal transduction histidine kinase